MNIVYAILILFLLAFALIIGYVARRKAGMRCKSDAVELVLCIITGVVILGVIMILW